MKRLRKIQVFLDDAKTREKVRKKVTLDWQKFEYSGCGKKNHVFSLFPL